MQSLAIHTEEQLRTQLAGEGFTLSRPCISVAATWHKSSNECESCGAEEPRLGQSSKTVVVRAWDGREGRVVSLSPPPEEESLVMCELFDGHVLDCRSAPECCGGKQQQHT